MDLIVMYSTLIISLVFIYFANRYNNKIRLLVKENKDKSVSYGQSMVCGIISGVIVIALDKIITQWVNLTTKPSLDISSAYNLTLSLTGIFIAALFVGSFLLLIVFFLVHRGLDVTCRRK